MGHSSARQERNPNSVSVLKKRKGEERVASRWTELTLHRRLNVSVTKPDINLLAARVGRRPSPAGEVRGGEGNGLRRAKESKGQNKFSGRSFSTYIVFVRVPHPTGSRTDRGVVIWAKNESEKVSNGSGPGNLQKVRQAAYRLSSILPCSRWLEQRGQGGGEKGGRLGWRRTWRSGMGWLKGEKGGLWLNGRLLRAFLPAHLPSERAPMAFDIKGESTAIEGR